MDRLNLMNTEKPYIPEVNDYVIWKNDLGTVDEGWVYWKGTPVDHKQRKSLGGDHFKTTLQSKQDYERNLIVSMRRAIHINTFIF